MNAILHESVINGKKFVCLYKFTYKDPILVQKDLENCIKETGKYMWIEESELFDTRGN